MTNFHAVKTAAVNDAARFFGFRSPSHALRRAFTYQTPERTNPGVLGALGYGAKWLGEFGRQYVLGDPYGMYREMRNYAHHAGGVPEGIGHFYKNYYWRKPNTLMALSNAYNVYNISKNVTEAALTKDPERRKGDLAVAATQLLGTPVTSRLGILGAFLQPKIDSTVRGLVQRSAPEPLPIKYDLTNHARATIRGVGAINGDSTD